MRRENKNTREKRREDVIKINGGDNHEFGNTI